jgi:succinylglutamic semialdehyde dehydrogenase
MVAVCRDIDRYSDRRSKSEAILRIEQEDRWVGPMLAYGLKARAMYRIIQAMSKGHFIHGHWIKGAGAEFVSTDPATGDIVWQGHAATEHDIDRAIQTARGAFPSWSDRPIQQRADVLHLFGEQLKKHHAEFNELICRETGKPRWGAATETDAMINKIAATIEAHGQRRQPTSFHVAGATAATHYKPYGVVAVFGPFNFPGHLPNGHIMPALLAGNAVVFKPSELTPAVAELTAELWHDAGLPAGVLNLVQGARETGQTIVQHSGIDGLFFTGSFEAGRAMNRALADQPGKIAALEMGGNNPLIVHKVKNIEAAAYWTIQSAYITAGQRCSCARRLILIDDNDAMIFQEHLSSMILRIKVGRYTELPEPFMGPVISEPAAGRLLAAQEDLLKRGARSLVEMKSIGPRQAMLSPGLIDVTDVNARADEELFGPLLQIIRVKDFDQAIREANNTRFGLTAGLLSDDASLWKAFYHRVRAGVVNWNRALTGASSQLPFGGVGCSGNNRPSASFAADYCSYPVASMESELLTMPEKTVPGIGLK